MNQVTLSENIFMGILQISQELNLSVNQLLEEINQGKLTVINTEELEDLIDFRDTVLAENNPKNDERISWEDVKKDLSL
ncbi:MAG: hypothetical protein GW795_13950 [Cyanobacteria bacterium]|nr:hypothetical protein [Cyanobacteria bacterium CG_2015-16_32_12]NCO79483.1 hypothetical protein [Cyanobacteria bacterium CG_2015-22_32_23]NCQ05578.1 hypothetical protein [Cyanobacteria bacterium CG_2015-09_32_10]NCQ42939.1 hypothetical protein [Cyanobacteria bacterium CG_2015-04_32_10]NCS83997.1 hypothetical protein [Cyanobacteria bacterium CG_2015-02_32_10]